jgi:Flp pilus assembly protein TadD
MLDASMSGVCWSCRAPVAAIVLGITIVFATSAHAGGPADGPPLPTLTLEAFPSDSRAAIESAARRARAAPDDPAAVGALARMLHAWEQWDAARAAYLRAQHLAPEDVEWPYLLGVVLQRLARPDEAARHLQRAVDLSPANPRARLRLGEALLDADRFDESARVLSSLADDPKAVPVAGSVLAFVRGRAAAEDRRHADAIAQFERAVALFPEFGAAHYRLALSLRAVGRRDDAAVALRRHQALGSAWPALEDPVLADVRAIRDDPRAMVQRALRQADAGDLAGAIAAHEAALARDPSLAQAHANLVRLHGRAGNAGRAEEHYRTVVALGFNLDEAHYDYGVLLTLQDRTEEAAAAYREALAVNPHHAEARNNLGQLLEREGRLHDAEAEYRRAKESRPTYRLARFNLARMLLATGRAQEAADELEALREPRDAEAPRYLFGLSVAYVQTGRKAEGLALAQDAERLAVAHGQHELAASIAREISRLR